MSNFRTFDRQTRFLLLPSVDDWLPQKHLARFVVELIDSLDVSPMSGAYRGSGSASYHPSSVLQFSPIMGFEISLVGDPASPVCGG